MRPLAVVLTLLAMQPAAPQPRVFFTTPLTLDQMKNKQAVVETTAGAFVIDLLPEVAPNHVGYFMKLAQEGGYTGTTFHRVVRQGIIQGGDPLTKDLSKGAQYGTGGLRMLKAEPSAEKHTRGAVSAVLAPNDPDSAGSQFFICIVDQPGLDGVHNVFGRVSEGIEVAQAISEAAADASGKVTERIEIRSIAFRDRPPVPFTSEAVEELATYRAVLETSLGSIMMEFFPQKAPEHVRNFLRLASAGVFDGMAFHRVVPGFVVQTGFLPTRREPLKQAQQRWVRTLQPEINDTKHVKGIVSMARGDDPASASTSFFMCTGPSTALDGQYSAFGRVVEGLNVLDAMEAAPRNGEAPVDRIELTRVRVERVGGR